MGYYSRMTGRIDINPPLPWALFKDSPALRGRAGGLGTDVALVVETETFDTEDGVLTKRRAVAVEAAVGDSTKNYFVVEHLQAVIDLAPGRTFTGYLECVGEDGDVWRVKVVNGEAREIKPIMTWPDE